MRNPDSVVLVGMSNIGKSFWAKRLEAIGYVRVCVDDEIEKRLGPHLTSLGYKGIADVSSWMGQPFDERYPANSALYLQYETEVMRDISFRLRSGGEKLVVDTTGSVIYVHDDLLAILRHFAIIVLLASSEPSLKELCDQYFAEPKPVLWPNRAFLMRSGETGTSALRRCFPDLVRSRNVLYYRLAEVVIPYGMHRSREFTTVDFLSEVHKT